MRKIIKWIGVVVILLSIGLVFKAVYTDFSEKFKFIKFSKGWVSNFADSLSTRIGQQIEVQTSGFVFLEDYSTATVVVFIKLEEMVLKGYVVMIKDDGQWQDKGIVLLLEGAN